jgi:hypothetical protein
MPSTAVVRTTIARTAPARVGGPAVEPFQAEPVLEYGNVHRIFAAEDAHWQPGGYEDAEPRDSARRVMLEISTIRNVTSPPT